MLHSAHVRKQKTLKILCFVICVEEDSHLQIYRLITVLNTLGLEKSYGTSKRHTYTQDYRAPTWNEHLSQTSARTYYLYSKDLEIVNCLHEALQKLRVFKLSITSS